MWADYVNRRTAATLDGLTRLSLTVRRCRNAACPAYRRPCRPEAEGRLALPHHEFGLDVVALVGARRYAEHRSAPEAHRRLGGRGLAVSERTVTDCWTATTSCSRSPWPTTAGSVGCWPARGGSSSPSTACGPTWAARCRG